ncbi:MAG: pur operon repressor, partial [Alicyclobacillus sp.]|nr:pur operon repressor [Alicyclobacillus sp.]
MQRSERLIRLTKRLLDSPNRPMPLSELSVNLEAAKSSISEDVTAIRQALEAEQTGTIESLTGAAGGVLYRVALAPAAKLRFRDAMQQRLADPSRVLPGGFLYMSDVLGDPDVLDTVGRLFAERFASAGANVVVTVETKGIP